MTPPVARIGGILERFYYRGAVVLQLTLVLRQEWLVGPAGEGRGRDVGLSA